MLPECGFIRQHKSTTLQILLSSSSLSERAVLVHKVNTCSAGGTNVELTLHLVTYWPSKYVQHIKY